jgi:hypothetical protein
MEDMVRDAQARGMDVMLGTLPLQRSGGPKAYNPEAIPEYNDALRVMAGRKNAQLVDIAAQFPMQLLGQDGLHPTDDGYQRIAEIWLEALKRRYEVPAETPAPGSTARAAESSAPADAIALQAPAGTRVKELPAVRRLR